MGDEHSTSVALRVFLARRFTVTSRAVMQRLLTARFMRSGDEQTADGRRQTASDGTWILPSDLVPLTGTRVR